MTEEIIINYFLLDYFMNNNSNKYKEIITGIKESNITNFIHYIQDSFDMEESKICEKLFELKNDQKYYVIKNNPKNYDKLIDFIKKELDIYDVDVSKNKYINYLYAKFLGRAQAFYGRNKSFLTKEICNYIEQIKSKMYDSVLIKNYPEIFYNEKEFTKEDDFDIKLMFNYDKLENLETFNSIKLELNLKSLSSIDDKGNLILNKPARNQIEESLSLIETLATDNLTLETIKNLRTLLK